MDLKYLILFYQLSALVYGDVLLDYAEKSFDNFPTWIQENLNDNISVDSEFHYSRRVAFIEYALMQWNVTASGMKTIRLLEKPDISGSLYSGDLTFNLKATVDLKFEGKYNASYGYLFPFVDNIPYDSLGMWSADATLITEQTYYVFMNASLNGSMGLVSVYQDWSNYKLEAIISNVEFDSFLEDHADQWYFPIMKEGFTNDIGERARLTFIYQHLDVFGGFFEKTFGNINYFDIIERRG